MKLQELINKHYNTLNENDIYIWNYISNNKKECQNLAIDQLAYKCNVSRTTILRFAQKISLKGYSELKLYLKLENEIVNESNNKIKIVCNNYNELIKSISEKVFNCDSPSGYNHNIVKLLSSYLDEYNVEYKVHNKEISTLKSKELPIINGPLRFW